MSFKVAKEHSRTSESGFALSRREFLLFWLLLVSKTRPTSIAAGQEPPTVDPETTEEFSDEFSLNIESSSITIEEIQALAEQDPTFSTLFGRYPDLALLVEQIKARSDQYNYVSYDADVQALVLINSNTDSKLYFYPETGIVSMRDAPDGFFVSDQRVLFNPETNTTIQFFVAEENETYSDLEVADSTSFPPDMEANFVSDLTKAAQDLDVKVLVTRMNASSSPDRVDGSRVIMNVVWSGDYAVGIDIIEKNDKRKLLIIRTSIRDGADISFIIRGLIAGIYIYKMRGGALGSGTITADAPPKIDDQFSEFIDTFVPTLQALNPEVYHLGLVLK